MKKLFAVALSAFNLLGLAAAAAQGLPPGTVPPQYGSQTWAARHNSSENRTIPMTDLRQAKASEMVVPSEQQNPTPSTHGG